MKILYFHQHFSTPQGSAGIRSYEMSRRLISRGHHVTMVCGSYQGGETGLTQPFLGGKRRGVVDGIDIIELNLAYSNHQDFLKRSQLFLQFALRSIGIALSEDYDLIFATSTPLTAGIPGILARWLRGKPFVFEVRDLWPEAPQSMGVIRNPLVLQALSALEWMSYHSAHRLIGLSPGMVAGIARRHIPSERITMIPNGCDLDIFNTPCEPWRPPEVKPEDLMAVYAGTHGIANGLEAVLQAAAELQKRGRHDIWLVLIGQGKAKPALQELQQREKLHNVLLLDPVPKKKLAGLMANTDLGLQLFANVPAFYYGTSPNKFFDYIASSLPVLTNYPGWVADMLRQYDCGYAVPPDNPIAFADALEHAANHREELKAKGQRSLSLARQEFSRDLLAERFGDWLEGAVS